MKEDRISAVIYNNTQARQGQQSQAPAGVTAEAAAAATTWASPNGGPAPAPAPEPLAWMEPAVCSLSRLPSTPNP